MDQKNRVTALSRAVKAASRRRQCTVLAALVAAGSLPALGQSSNGEAAMALEEVIVTARRKDESVQDVPLTVNFVTARQMEDLNIRKFEDLQGVVAGLTLQEDSIAPNASMRGVRFDTFASGFNPTVEFYLNDAPYVSLSAMQSMFDIQQVEVLRGPQGTLRGRASPSGAITITTQRPNMSEFGGYVDVTATDQDGQNYRGALNVPLIEDIAALRVAGFYEENEGNQVESITTGVESKYEGEGWRASLAVDPTENLSIDLMYQKVEPDRWLVPQVESASIADPSLDPSPELIRADDRKGVSDSATFAHQELERTNLNVAWAIGDHELNYVGSYTEMLVERKNADDSGDFFGPDAPEDLQNFGQQLTTATESTTHELRLSSLDPLFNDRLDYVVGAMYQDVDTPSDLLNPTAVFLMDNFLFVQDTPIQRLGGTTEKSAFANLTYYITESTELSGGLRYIDFTNESSLIVDGNLLSTNDNEWTETIYSLSLKHEFSYDLMAYFNYGSSWRPGLDVVGDFNTRQTPLERSFLQLEPETSDSYEVGMKSVWLDNRLIVNLSAFYQDFENYPYRAGGQGVYFVSTDSDGLESVDNFNFVAPVPISVYGVELESTFNITQNWSANALISYAKGEIDDGTVPCNDYGGAVPSIADIRAASNGDNLATCQVDFRSNYAPLWTTTLQSEYHFPVGSFEGYVRGLWTIYGDSKNDPSNAVDDVDSYNVFNIYAGLREPNRKWEVMLYGKNLFDTQEIVSRDANQASTSFTNVTLGPSGPTPVSETGLTPWRVVTITAPQEFGVNLRYNF